MASCLSNRKLFISNSEIKTDMEIVQYGVPQGSNTGPLMFLVYINDLPHSYNFEVKLFAHDTCLLLHSKNPTSLKIKINEVLTYI